MQTAALVYRPLMPAHEQPRHAGEAPFKFSPPKTLRVLVAGHLDLPIQFIGDRLSRLVSRATAPDFQTVLNLIKDLPYLDLVILDASLPGFDADAGLRKVCELAASAPVVVVCRGGEERKAAELLRNGACGVIPDTLCDDSVASAIQLILAGQRFAPAELLIEKSGGSDGAVIGTLSNREREVAGLIAQGCPNKEIACRLGLQEITIKVYASAIFRKLGVRNRTAAAARLLAEGI